MLQLASLHYRSPSARTHRNPHPGRASCSYAYPQRGWHCAQPAVLLTPTIAEFQREPIPFFEFHWAGETPHLSAREAIYRFRPDDGRPPEVWRASPNAWDLVFIAPDAETIIAEDLDSVRGELTIRRQVTDSANGWRDERLVIPAGDAVPPWTAYSRDGKRAAILLPDGAAQRLQLKLYDLDAGTLVTAVQAA